MWGPHRVLRLRYPAYWHYDVVQALVKLVALGLVGDPRTADALDPIEGRRRPDGDWAVEGT